MIHDVVQLNGYCQVTYIHTVRVDWALTFERMHWTLVPDAKTLLDITRVLMGFKSRHTNPTPKMVFLHIRHFDLAL